jgi:hypothetical protein
MVLDNKAVVEAFTNDPITPNAADIYLENFGNGAMFRTGTYIALTIVADIFIVCEMNGVNLPVLIFARQVYRVYAVWGGSLIAAALPSLLAIADIGGLFNMRPDKLTNPRVHSHRGLVNPSDTRTRCGL